MSAQGSIYDEGMGTFSEVVLGFSFRSDTPDHVLAAFSALVVPQSADERYPAPPPLAMSDDEGWDSTNEEDDPQSDPEPWKHDWAGWFSSSMSVSIALSAQMVWLIDHWRVTCRWGIKSWPEAIISALTWLGPYLQAFDKRPILLGHIDCGSDERPTLVWLTPQHEITAKHLGGERW
jgi:hypothetical protein